MRRKLPLFGFDAERLERYVRSLCKRLEIGNWFNAKPKDTG